jgi:hypothetical protein
MMPAELHFHQAGAAFFITGFAVLGSALLLGLMMLLQATAPDLVARSAAGLRERPYLSLGAGIALAACLGTLARFAAPAAPFALAIFTGLGLFGLAATSENLGRRIAWISGKEGARFSHLVTGWLVFAGASCVPYVGWLLILPWGVLSGLGSLVVGLAVRPAPPPSHIE